MEDIVMHVSHKLNSVLSLSEKNLYNIIRKTWKGINQTKMEGGDRAALTKD